MPSGHAVVILIRPGRPSLLKWDARQAIHPLREPLSLANSQQGADSAVCDASSPWVENTNVYELSHGCNSRGLCNLRSWDVNSQTDATGQFFSDLFLSFGFRLASLAWISSKNICPRSPDNYWYFNTCLLSLNMCLVWKWMKTRGPWGGFCCSSRRGTSQVSVPFVTSTRAHLQNCIISVHAWKMEKGKGVKLCITRHFNKRLETDIIIRSIFISPLCHL